MGPSASHITPAVTPASKPHADLGHQPFAPATALTQTQLMPPATALGDREDAQASLAAGSTRQLGDTWMVGLLLLGWHV